MTKTLLRPTLNLEMSFRNRSKNFTKNNSKFLLILFLFVLLIGGGIFVIRTSAQTTNITFTGCLDTNKGDFYSFTLGSTPLKTCKNGDTQVNWNDTTYSAGQGLVLNGNQFSITDQGITTAKIADNAVTLAKLASQTKTKTWSQNNVSGSSNASTTMSSLSVTLSTPSTVLVLISGEYWSDTGDWTWMNIERDGTQIAGRGIGSPSNPTIRETFSNLAVETLPAGTYVYNAKIAPSGSTHFVHWEAVSFATIAFPN